jgi:hypothetical protein
MMANKSEKIALNKIAELGCILCAEVLGFEGTPAELHHVRRYGSVRATSPILPLCPEHHRLGNDSFHQLGICGFERKWQVSCSWLLEQVDKRLGKKIKK